MRARPHLVGSITASAGPPIPRSRLGDGTNANRPDPARTEEKK